MRERVKKVLTKGAVVLAVGCAYYVFMRLTGVHIPCVFRLVTGLKCPGCGVTTMLLKLINLDFTSAFRANMVLFCMLPAFAVLFILWLVRYIKTGKQSLTRAENIISIVLLTLLIAWGIVRNIAGV